MSNGKTIIIHLIVGLIKKGHIKMSESFSKPKSLWGNVKAGLDLSMQQKHNWRRYTLESAKKTDPPNLKYDVGKLDIDKFKNVPSGLINSIR